MLTFLQHFGNNLAPNGSWQFMGEERCHNSAYCGETIKTETMTQPLLQYYKKSHYKSKGGDEEYIENKKAIVMNLVYNQFGSGVSAENIWNSLNSSTCPKFEVDPLVNDAGTIEKMKTLYNSH